MRTCKLCRKPFDGEPGRAITKSGRRWCNRPAWNSTTYLCKPCHESALKFGEESRAQYLEENAKLVASLSKAAQ